MSALHNQKMENAEIKRESNLHPPQANAIRERTRVKTLRCAFMDLQRALPVVPQGTKLSKLDVLILATVYIRQLISQLNDDNDDSLINDSMKSESNPNGDKTVQVYQYNCSEKQTELTDGDQQVRNCESVNKNLNIGNNTTCSTMFDENKQLTGRLFPNAFHPVKKWPMRCRLFYNMSEATFRNNDPQKAGEPRIKEEDKSA